jgi:hypothetical protein
MLTTETKNTEIAQRKKAGHYLRSIYILALWSKERVDEATTPREEVILKTALPPT